MSHLRYLRYVLMHKAYVFRAGLAVGTPPELSRLRWWWRLLVHDLSKFRPSEWRPYVEKFYGSWEATDPSPETNAANAASLVAWDQRIEREFSAAWLRHIHRNPHHWQHWILHRDDGRVVTLTMPIPYVDEMVADWLGAGPKVLRWPTLDEAVRETLVWYRENAAKLSLRTPVRARVEAQLVALAGELGITVPQQLAPIAEYTFGRS